MNNEKAYKLFSLKSTTEIPSKVTSLSAIFEILNIKDIENIISNLDENKKAKLIEIMKTIK